MAPSTKNDVLALVCIPVDVHNVIIMLVGRISDIRSFLGIEARIHRTMQASAEAVDIHGNFWVARDLF